MEPLVVVIDPGHGGRLSYGATWPRFTEGKGLVGDAVAKALADFAKDAKAVEKDINLAIAHEAKVALEGSGWPVTCELTRETDEALALDARAAVAAKHGADLVVAIHCDTSPDPDVAGLWTYVRSGDPVGLSVARDIMVACPRPLRRGSVEPKVTQPRPHWTGAAHAVMAHNGAPTVLIECGFLSNDNDRAILTSAAGRALVVSAVMAGVGAYVYRRSAMAVA